MKVKELIALIEAKGWLQVWKKGSHRQFHHPSKPGTVTVSGKPSVDVQKWPRKSEQADKWRICYLLMALRGFNMEQKMAKRARRTHSAV
ncbi:MAG: type II toxin-antitoxin system HicA family toxin, partial [Gammaproteobacteria bacterium]|nr:type II toxin-antitoxin system HicA family toxin [Gammaproteobacteria bacterium]